MLPGSPPAGSASWRLRRAAVDGDGLLRVGCALEMASAMLLFSLSSYSATLRLPASACAIASRMRFLQMSLYTMPGLAPVLLHVCALLAALGIAMTVKITLVEAHGA